MFTRIGLVGSVVLGSLVLANPAFAQGKAPWEGVYAGLHGGYGFGTQKGDLTYLGSPDSIFTPGQKLDFDGWLGGVQVGVNRQSGAWVFGTEADISASSISGSATFNSTLVNPANPPQSAFSKDISTRIDYFGTARARIGYSVGGFMPYVTGGVAWGRTDSDLTVTNNYLKSLGILSGPSGTGKSSEFHVGWTAGFGGEVLLGSRWTMKAEYLHIDLGTRNYSYTGTIAPGIGGGVFNTDGFKSSLAFDTVRLGLNYRFYD